MTNIEKVVLLLCCLLVITNITDAPPVYAQQMTHAVVYAPLDQAKSEVGAASDLFEAKGCAPRYIWFVSRVNDAYGVWYGYLSDEEARCLLDSGSAKVWTGPSAKAAWKAAFVAGLPESAAAVEKSLKVPVQVIDSETGKQAEKYLPLDEAKALDPKSKIDASLFERSGDAMLPRKIFDGSK